MADKERYKNMGDHDILVEVAVRQEVMEEKVNDVHKRTDDQEQRITRQEATCAEARKTVFNEINRLRNGQNCGTMDKPKRSKKEVGGITGGTVAMVVSIIYAIGCAVGWW